MVSPIPPKPLSYAERARRAQNIRSSISAPPPPQYIVAQHPSDSKAANPGTSSAASTASTTVSSTAVSSISTSAEDSPNSPVTPVTLVTTRSPSPSPPFELQKNAEKKQGQLAAKALDIVAAHAKPAVNVWNLRTEKMAAARATATSYAPPTSRPTLNTHSGSNTSTSLETNSNSNPTTKENRDPFIVHAPVRPSPTAAKDPDENWPAVGKSVLKSGSDRMMPAESEGSNGSVAKGHNGAGVVNGTSQPVTPPRKGEKTKWVLIPPEELQAAADLAFAKAPSYGSSSRAKHARSKPASSSSTQSNSPQKYNPSSKNSSEHHTPKSNSAAQSRVQSRSESGHSSPRAVKGRRLHNESKNSNDTTTTSTSTSTTTTNTKIPNGEIKGNANANAPPRPTARPQANQQLLPSTSTHAFHVSAPPFYPQGILPPNSYPSGSAYHVPQAPPESSYPPTHPQHPSRPHYPQPPPPAHPHPPSHQPYSSAGYPFGSYEYGQPSSQPPSHFISYNGALQQHQQQQQPWTQEGAYSAGSSGSHQPPPPQLSVSIQPEQEPSLLLPPPAIGAEVENPAATSTTSSQPSPSRANLGSGKSTMVFGSIDPSSSSSTSSASLSPILNLTIPSQGGFNPISDPSTSTSATMACGDAATNGVDTESPKTFSIGVGSPAEGGRSARVQSQTKEGAVGMRTRTASARSGISVGVGVEVGGFGFGEENDKEATAAEGKETTRGKGGREGKRGKDPKGTEKAKDEREKERTSAAPKQQPEGVKWKFGTAESTPPPPAHEEIIADEGASASVPPPPPRGTSTLSYLSVEGTRSFSTLPSPATIADADIHEQAIETSLPVSVTMPSFGYHSVSTYAIDPRGSTPFDGVRTTTTTTMNGIGNERMESSSPSSLPHAPSNGAEIVSDISASTTATSATLAPLTTISNVPLSAPATQTLPATINSAQSDPDLEVKDYGFGFGDASGSGYATALAKEEMLARQRAWEMETREREWHHHQQQQQQQQQMGTGGGGGHGAHVASHPINGVGHGDMVEGANLDPNLKEELNVNVGALGPPPLRDHREPMHMGAGGRGRRGFGSGDFRGARGFGPAERGGGAYNGRRGGQRGGINTYSRGGYGGGGRGGYVRSGGPGGGPRGVPPYSLTPPQPHFQALMPMTDGSGPLPPSLPQQAPPGSSVGGYYNPPPRQQHLASFFQPPPGGFDAMYGVGPHQGALPQQPHLGVAVPPVPHISPPVPAPLSTISFPLDTTRYYLLGQLEYYLSPQNMAQDFYLRKHMDVRGWIPIPLIASFNRVRQLTMDAQLVREVLTLSTLVQVRGNMVRMGGWEQYVLPDAPASAVEEQPLPHVYQSMSTMGGFYGDGGQQHQQQLQEQYQHQHQLHPPLGIAGSALWQGTHHDDGPDGLRMGGRDDGVNLPLNRNGGTIDGHHDHPSAAESAAAAEDAEDEEDEEEEDVVFVMGHEVGTTWSPERRA